MGSPEKAVRDRGSVLILMPAAVFIVMVLSAIAVDLSLVHLGEREAAAAASAAANDAATGAIDDTDLYDNGAYAIDPVRADQIARRSIAAQELTGSLDRLTVSVSPDRTSVTVTVDLRVDYIFARTLPNSPDSTTVTATVTADIVEG
jgi:Flp pilus assembly protein TadG